MKIKTILLLLAIITFIGASCNRAPKDEGVYKSTDAGNTWELKNDIIDDGSLNSDIIYTLSIDPDNTQNIVLGTKGKGVFFSDNQGESWQPSSLDIEDIHSIKHNPKDPSEVYAAGSTADFGKIFKSEDNGKTFSEIYSETHSNTPVTTLCIDSYDPKKIYAGIASGAIIKSIDGGNSWVVSNWFNNEITAISIYPKDTRSIFVGTKSQGLYYSKNAGGDWTDFEDQFKEYKKSDKIHSISFDNNDNLYVGSSYGLLSSTDLGKTWKDIKLLVEPGDASSIKIAVDPFNGQNLFLGIDTTIYKSTNNGKNWKVIKITDNIIESLAINPDNPDILFAGIKKAKNN